MIHVVEFMETNAQGIALGRTDQYLYPYYRTSLDDGTYTKDFMQELIEFLYLKLTAHSRSWRRITAATVARRRRGWTGTALIVGGTDADGNDATNDLSFMLLDAQIHTRLINPYTTVRWHEGTPYELKAEGGRDGAHRYGPPEDAQRQGLHGLPDEAGRIRGGRP